ncbi:MAG: ATP-binding protein [Bacteroidota bacterium]
MSNVEMMQRRLERERQARKAAEKLLEEKSREIFEINRKLSQVALFADLSPNPVLRFDTEGALLLANERAKNVLGEQVFMGNTLSSMLPQFADLNIKQIVEGSEIFQATTQMEASHYQFTFKGIAPHGFVNVYASDVTQQELAKKMIEASHRETEQMLASISSILVGVDKDRKITRWNEMASNTLGLTGEAVLGRDLNACEIPWSLGSLEGYMAESKYVDHAMVPEIPFTAANGKEGFLSVVVNVVYDANNSFNGYLILAIDITDRKVLEGQLMQAQKLESLGQLAAGIAHEINTPIQFIGDNTRFLGVAFERLNTVIEKGQQLLNEVQGGTGMMVQAISEMEEAVKKGKLKYMAAEIPFAIEETLGGVDQVASIVRSMKQFSHPGSKQKVLSNINEAILSTINVARNEWKYIAELTTNLAEDLPEVPCFQSELNQVVLNMIVNAAHAIEDKNKETKAHGQITITTRYTETDAEILISDTGAGIPDHVVSKIFDPFYTTKEVGKGSGQGLAVAYNVIYEKHGGAIDVDTTPGEGTTFTIRIPLNEETEEVAV